MLPNWDDEFMDRIARDLDEVKPMSTADWVTWTCIVGGCGTAALMLGAWFWVMGR